MPDKEHWHLSKNVPIAIILTLALQTVGAAYWVGQLASRVDRNTEQIVENQQDIKGHNTTEPRLVRVETDITYIRQAIDDQKSKLKDLDDKLTEILRGTPSRRPR